MRSISAREFNRDVSAAKRSADDGPVVVTDRGEPAYVLLTFGDYRALVEGPVGIATLLGRDAADDPELDLPERHLSDRDRNR